MNNELILGVLLGILLVSMISYWYYPFFVYEVYEPIRRDWGGECYYELNYTSYTIPCIHNT